MDKGPIMGLEESYPFWSPESEGSRVDHVTEMRWGPNHTGLCWPWKDVGIYTRTRPKTEGLLSSLSHPFLLSPFSPLLTTSHCLGFWVLSQSNSCSQSSFPFSHYQSLNPRFFDLKRTSEVINSSPLILHIRKTRPQRAQRPWQTWSLDFQCRALCGLERMELHSPVR